MKQTNNNTTLQYLNNIHNYQEIFDPKLKAEDILTKLVFIIKEYIDTFNAKMKPKHLKNEDFIYVKGFETVIHVFETILLYTKNIELTKYHSHKAIYFFIEFTEQITDEQNSFLQLSSKDASMFVYKKTIFEINNEYKRKLSPLDSKEQELLQKVNIFITIYKLLVTNKILDFSNDSINLISLIEKINKLKFKTAQTLLNLISQSISNNIIVNININTVILTRIEKFLNKCNNKEYVKKIADNMYLELEDLDNIL